jgi:hypothetical protein
MYTKTQMSNTIFFSRNKANIRFIDSPVLAGDTGGLFSEISR